MANAFLLGYMRKPVCVSSRLGAHDSFRFKQNLVGLRSILDAKRDAVCRAELELKILRIYLGSNQYFRSIKAILTGRNKTRDAALRLFLLTILKKP